MDFVVRATQTDPPNANVAEQVSFVTLLLVGVPAIELVLRGPFSRSSNPVG
jgi:hypothetical protein